MLLDEIQSKYHFRQRREKDIEASPAVIYKSIWDYPINESLPFKVLMGLRNLPARLVGRGSYLPGGELTVARWLSETHFTLLTEKENEEIVFGLIGQFWKPLYGRILIIPEVDKFMEFEETGFVKTAANFYIEPRDEGARLSIEVRIYATDRKALWGFWFYWRLIEPFGGLLRADMIRRIKGRAEMEMKTL
jgi:hypothetical protein